MAIKNPLTKMMSLETGYADLGKERIAINKAVSKINRQARERSKESVCCLCGKVCSSFCNSHSVPEFSLKKIAEKGYVAQVLQGEFPTMGDATGLNKAGTFHLICNECDNTMFYEYENPEAYSQKPNERMLAQIAMKNTLQMISKRKQEIELYDVLDRQYENIHFIGTGKSIEELDLTEYQTSLRYAINSLSEQKTGCYNLCFFKVLDYVVPIATQSSLCLVGDLEDGVINNIYNLSEQYHMASIHVAVFPLEETSVVLLFTESTTKRYRKFIRQLKKIEPIDQLSAINYMLFSYTENIFLHPGTYENVRKNRNFMEVCRRTTIAETPLIFENHIQTAIEEFSFSKRNTIPNLLSKEYALKQV